MSSTRGGRRLRLRLVNEPSFLRYIGDRGVRTLADARKYIADGPVAGYARYGHGLLRVVRKSDGVALGMCGVLKRDTLPDPDIGFSFFPEHWIARLRARIRPGRHEACARDARARPHRRDHDEGQRALHGLLGKLGFRFDGLIKFGAEELRHFVSDP